MSTDVERHSEQIAQLTADVQILRDVQAEQSKNLDSIITEMRDGFDKLILSNEITRDLANNIGKLAAYRSWQMGSEELGTRRSHAGQIEERRLEEGSKNARPLLLHNPPSTHSLESS